MISMPLWKREWKANTPILILFILLLMLYCGIIIAMYDPESDDMLHMMAQQMPDLFAAFGMSNVSSNLLEFTTNYLYGFILIVIPFLGIVLCIHRLVVRYIDRGSMAYLLATGNSRAKIIRTQALFVIVFVIVMCVYVTCFLFLTSYLLHGELLPIATILFLNFGLCGLLLALSSIVFLTGVSFNESKWAIGVGSGIGIVFLLIQMLAQIGDKMSFLKYLTITSLFQSDAIIHSEGTPIFGILVLYAIAALCFVIAMQIFQKRDLPL